MFGDLQLAYAIIEVADPDTVNGFFADVIGLVPGAPTPAGATTWRDDAKAQRVIVTEGPRNDAVVLGFEAREAAGVPLLAGRLGAGGWDTTEGDAAERRARAVVSVRAPFGVDVEIVHDLADGAEPFASPTMPGGFLTESVGFGHAVIATMAFDESVRFVTEGLGMTRSDWLEAEIAPGIDLEVAFFHCNARHHTLALAKPPFELPQKLHHLMFETQRLDDVGAAFDRAWKSGLPIPNGLGKHDNDHMFSFYVASPAGFLVEVGHGARTVTADWADDRRYDLTSVWGHQALR